IFDLRLDQRREGPGLFGRDPLIGRLAVDLACRRCEPDARAMAEVFFEVALEALLAAVFEQWHIDNLSLQALAPSGERVGRGGCRSHRRSPSSLSALPPLPFRGEGSCSEHPVVVESGARIGNRLHDVPVLADIAVGDPQDVDDRVTGVIRFPAKMEMYR